MTLDELREYYGTNKAIAQHINDIIFRYSHTRLLLQEDGIVAGEDVANDIYFLRDLQKIMENLPEPIKA